MSYQSFEMDLDTEVLWEEELEEEANPAPPLPVDALQPLVCGEDQLFTDSQLVAFVAEPSRDPAPESPTPQPAQIVDLPGMPLHIESWAEEM